MLNREVPAGKRVYFGKFRCVEGDILPPHIAARMPQLEIDEPEIIPDISEEPKKYVRKKKSDEVFE
jgi:hypothetical protein